MEKVSNTPVSRNTRSGRRRVTGPTSKTPVARNTRKGKRKKRNNSQGNMEKRMTSNASKQMAGSAQKNVNRENIFSALKNVDVYLGQHTDKQKEEGLDIAELEDLFIHLACEVFSMHLNTQSMQLLAQNFPNTAFDDEDKVACSCLFLGIEGSEGDGKQLENLNKVLKETIQKEELHSEKSGLKDGKLTLSGKYISCEMEMHICLGYLIPCRDGIGDIDINEEMFDKFMQAVESFFPLVSDEELFGEDDSLSFKARMLKKTYGETLRTIADVETKKIDKEALLNLIKVHDWEMFCGILKRYLIEVHKVLSDGPRLISRIMPKLILQLDEMQPSFWKKLPKLGQYAKNLKENIRAPANMPGGIQMDRGVRTVLENFGCTESEMEQIRCDVETNRDKMANINETNQAERDRRGDTTERPQDSENPGRVEVSPRKSPSKVSGSSSTNNKSANLSTSKTKSNDDEMDMNMQDDTTDDEDDERQNQTVTYQKGDKELNEGSKLQTDKSSTPSSGSGSPRVEGLQKPFVQMSAPAALSVNQLHNASSNLTKLIGDSDPLKDIIESTRATSNISSTKNQENKRKQPRDDFKENDSKENVSSNTMEIPCARPKKQKRIPWSPEEVQALEDGIRHFGAGNWTKIMTHFGNNFHACRNPMSLKDKWRNIVRAKQRQS